GTFPGFEPFACKRRGGAGKAGCAANSRPTAARARRERSGTEANPRSQAMKPFALFALGLIPAFPAAASAQILVSAKQIPALEASETARAEEGGARVERTDPQPLAALPKGARERVSFNRATSTVDYFFVLQNPDERRALVAGVMVKSICARPDRTLGR